METGYDEILLYLLFNEFVTFKNINKINKSNIITDIEEIKQIKDRFNNTIYNKENILFIDIDQDPNEIITELENKQIINKGLKIKRKLDQNMAYSYILYIDAILKLENLNRENTQIINMGIY